MNIKITGRNPERFNENLKSVLNAACVMAMGGYIPSPIEMSTPEQRGKYWFIENDGVTNKFHLSAASNDYFAQVVDEGENFIVLRFHYRYDKQDSSFCDALTQLIAIRFSYCSQIIVNA